MAVAGGVFLCYRYARQYSETLLRQRQLSCQGTPLYIVRLGDRFVDSTRLFSRGGRADKRGVFRGGKSTMGFSLYNLFKAGLLVANAVTILNPKRFLKTCKSFLRPPQAPDE